MTTSSHRPARAPRTLSRAAAAAVAWRPPPRPGSGRDRLRQQDVDAAQQVPRVLRRVQRLRIGRRLDQTCFSRATNRPATGRGSSVEVRASDPDGEHRRQALVLGVGEDRRARRDHLRPGGVQQSPLIGGSEARVAGQELQQVGRVGGRVDPPTAVGDHAGRARRAGRRARRRAASCTRRVEGGVGVSRAARPRGRAPRTNGARRSRCRLADARRRFSDSRPTSSPRSSASAASSDRTSHHHAVGDVSRHSVSGEPRKRASLTRPNAESPAGTVQSFASASQKGFPRFSAEGDWERAGVARQRDRRPRGPGPEEQSRAGSVLTVDPEGAAVARPSSGGLKGVAYGRSRGESDPGRSREHQGATRVTATETKERPMRADRPEHRAPGGRSRRRMHAPATVRVLGRARRGSGFSRPSSKGIAYSSPASAARGWIGYGTHIRPAREALHDRGALLLE